MADLWITKIDEGSQTESEKMSWTLQAKALASGVQLSNIFKQRIAANPLLVCVCVPVGFRMFRDSQIQFPDIHPECEAHELCLKDNKH